MSILSLCHETVARAVQTFTFLSDVGGGEPIE